ncbi:MAG: hypothetical protein OEZ43_11630 [Gammaproteobacteria bacterium]|nr:hypothetical protein [Gammaproteobacteria bacterium]
MSKYPSNEDAFLLEPKELMDQFPDIERYHLETNGIPLVDEQTYPSLVKDWGEPDKIRKIKGEIVLDSTKALAAASLPLIPLSPDPLSIAAFAGFIGLEAGLIYLASPNIHRSSWQKGNYRIDTRIGMFGEDQQFVFWEWFHRDKECDCYKPILSQRAPTAMFIDFHLGSSIEQSVINGVFEKSAPKFSSAIFPGVNLRVTYPLKVDISIGLHATRTAYFSTVQQSQYFFSQASIKLGMHKPIALNERLRLGAGTTIPISSYLSTPDNPSTRFTDKFPGLFLRLDYMMNRSSQLGYVVTYDHLETHKIDDVKLNQFALFTSLRFYF